MNRVLPQPKKSIAGHSFDSWGVCTLGDCKKRLADILGASKDDVGKAGWAHVGTLNETELAEIEAERERMWEAHTAQKA